ncbi:MAG: amidophosphoribosyltransferase, partial [Butyricicoccaceae bacterium]
MFADAVHEECGVFGIYLGANDIGRISPAHEAYTALFALQHRGQEACGIAVNNDGVIKCHKDIGLVNDVFNQEILDSMPGNMAIGHVRYSTTGLQSRENAQPISITHIKGNLAIVHNGNLVNAGELRRKFEMNGAIFRGSSDTEVLTYTIVRERLTSGSIEKAVLAAMRVIEGAYSLVIMSPRKLIAARDPHGFRPLCMGRMGESIVFASESCALDSMGAEFIRDIEPGEIVVVEDGEIRSMHCGIKCPSTTCVFEYIYFARPDSIVDGASVE